MPALLLLRAMALQPRFAFLLLAGLIVGAAVPLAIGWARLLPEELPPFEIENPRRRSPLPVASIYGEQREAQVLDLSGVALLVLLSVSFALQFPGVPRDVGLNDGLYYLLHAPSWQVVVIPAIPLAVTCAAILHGTLRRTLIRTQLVAGGILVLLLWLLAPWLYVAFRTI